MNAHAELDTDRVRIHVHHARTWWQRARGLIAYPEPRHGAGMFFPKTNAVHGMGMAHAMDIVFLDRDQTVLCCCRLPRFGMRICRRARAVLELREGEASRLDIRPGMRLQLVPDDDIFCPEGGTCSAAK